MQIVLAVLGSGAFFTFIQYLINRYDSRRSELKTIQKEITTIRGEIAENKVTTSRRRILDASDAILNTGVHHSKEWFDQLLDDIDNYDRYCVSHPDYRNSVAVSAIANIKRIYQQCLETSSFLKE